MLKFRKLNYAIIDDKYNEQTGQIEQIDLGENLKKTVEQLIEILQGNDNSTDAENLRAVANMSAIHSHNKLSIGSTNKGPNRSESQHLKQPIKERDETNQSIMRMQKARRSKSVEEESDSLQENSDYFGIKGDIQIKDLFETVDELGMVQPPDIETDE